MDKNIETMVSNMTVEEKASLCSGKDFWNLKAVETLGIPSIMVSDGPHGLRKSTGKKEDGFLGSVPATCFPTASALASTWDLALIEKVGKTIAIEAKSERVSVVLGPGANIKRHPYCGRNFEYFSEDPLLSGKMAASFIRGVQSEGVGTSLKHFVANNQETNRLVTNAVIDERTLREIYLKSFEIAIKESKPWTVMSAYNMVNGIYMSEHGRLLNHILRDEWGFEGLVMTDWGGCNDRVKGLENGQDLQMPGTKGTSDKEIVDAVNKGTLDTDILDKAAGRVLDLILKGKHVREEGNPFNADAHHEIARQVAAEGMVLLKNDDKILPLSSDKKLALIGDFAKKPRYQGSGSSKINPIQVDNVYDSFMQKTQAKATFARGFDMDSETVDDALMAEAMNIAKDAEVVVLMMGLPERYESEGFDRTHMSLPENQLSLIEKILEVNPNVVVTLSNGAPVELPFNDDVPAILETYLSGQAGGSATVDILFGTTVPGGKLAESFPFKASDLAADKFFPGDLHTVEYREGPFVGYRYLDTASITPMYPFGHGLSYSEFRIRNMTLHKKNLEKEDTINVRFVIENRGDVRAKETVQLYVAMKDSKVARVKKELKGFKKITLDPLESIDVEIELSYNDLAYYDTKLKKFTVEEGPYVLMLGLSSKEIHQKEEIYVLGHRPNLVNSLYMAVDAHFNPSKEAFEGLLGYPIEAPLDQPYFHENTTLSKFSTTVSGKMLKFIVKRNMLKMMGDDQTNRRMMDAMIDAMPIRFLHTMSGGAMSKHTIQGFIDLANKQRWKGIKRLLFKR